MTTGFKTQLTYLAIEASSASFYGKRESVIGKTVTDYSWTDRQPHPNNMTSYDDWANDPEASVAYNVLTDIIAGVGYHTEMPDEFKPKNPNEKPHKNKQFIDTYGEDINLDEKMEEVTQTELQKGFCPVERLEDYNLKILPPESFYVWKTKKNVVYRYTQERSVGDIISRWEDPNWKSRVESCKEYYDKKDFSELMKTEARQSDAVGKLEDIIVFYHRKNTSWPYGKSLSEPIGPLLDDRAQMNLDMPKAIHRWAYPIPVVSTSRSKDTLQSAFTDRNVDDAVFVGNVNPDEFKMDTLAIDPQARFIPYIELIYYQICEGLHAPLLLYLKNATEASATVMMESVDRLVNGRQRYNKRRMEHYLFKPQVGDPVPRVVWGQPKTGLEDVTLTDVASIINSPKVPDNQAQYILKQFFSGLPEPEYPPEPKMPFQPFQPQKPQVSMEQVLERLNDMQTGLNIIETNFVEGKISIREACRLAERTITVHMKRAYPNGWEAHTEKKFREFIRERVMGVPSGSKEFKVSVRD